MLALHSKYIQNTTVLPFLLWSKITPYFLWMISIASLPLSHYLKSLVSTEKLVWSLLCSKNFSMFSIPFQVLKKSPYDGLQDATWSTFCTWVLTLGLSNPSVFWLYLLLISPHLMVFLLFQEHSRPAPSFQPLCVLFLFAWNSLTPGILKVHSLSSFISLLKYSLLSKTSLMNLLKFLLKKINLISKLKKFN